MEAERIARWRMQVQALTGKPLPSPGDTVHRLGAVQAQDYGPAKWSVAQRTNGVKDPDMDKALADGDILRTHALRPTWHFVSPSDIRWIQQVTGPRVQARNAHRYRQLELDADELHRSSEVITRSLEGGVQLTRREIASLLQGAGIPTDGQRLAYILMNAELECVICSGALKGKQHTYALLEERVPRTKPMTYEEALAELTLRYFSGHGPSTAKDFATWSSLKMSDINDGLAMASPQLQNEVFDGETYWFSDRTPRSKPRSPKVHLLQGYDEYIMGYKHTRWLLDLSGRARRMWRERAGFNGVLVLDTQVAGQWGRTPKTRSGVIQTITYAALDDPQMAALEAEASRFGNFLGVAHRVEASML